MFPIRITPAAETASLVRMILPIFPSSAAESSAIHNESFLPVCVDSSSDQICLTTAAIPCGPSLLDRLLNTSSVTSSTSSVEFSSNCFTVSLLRRLGQTMRCSMSAPLSIAASVLLIPSTYALPNWSLFFRSLKLRASII